MGFGKCIKMCLSSQCHTEYVLCSKNVLGSNYSFLPPTTLHNHWSLYYLHISAFSRVSYSWKHSGCSLSDWLLSLVICIQVCSMSSCGLIARFWLLHNIASSGFTNLFIHSPTEGRLDCFQNLAAMNKASCRFLCGSKFSTYLYRYWGTGSYSQSVTNLVRNCKLSSTIAAAFCIPTSNECAFLLFHILVSTYYSQRSGI